MCDSTWLQKGKLKSRVTMIPLNKIDSRGTISDEKVRLAQKLVGKENACTALSLVGYDDELESAMAYVFGRSFVCTDAESANKVTSDRKIRTKTVTLDGDEYSPSGTLSGGSKKKAAPILERMQALRDAKKALAMHTEALQRVSKQLKEVQAKGDKYRNLLSQIEVKEHKTGLLQTRIGPSPAPPPPPTLPSAPVLCSSVPTVFGVLKHEILTSPFLCPRHVRNIAMFSLPRLVFLQARASTSSTRTR